MKEINDIIVAYQLARKAGQRSALATVVRVEGSSYRRPGARMLITEDGLLTGAISGGCLEGDALKKALSAIHQQENRLVTYDTTDEDDAKFGVQLGCNGIVHILFEPIDGLDENNPIKILESINGERENAVIITLFSLESKTHLGTRSIIKSENRLGNLPTSITSEILADVQQVLDSEESELKNYKFENELIDGFIEFIKPPIALVIAGAGNDAQPLATIAHLLGWQVTIADGRPTHATRQRFPNAKTLVTKPAQLLPQLNIDAQTAIVLITHNYNYDTEFLGLLLQTDVPYIGALGPKKKLLRMLDKLDMNTEANRSRVYGPVGLDIGAETAEEIAISIIAEIKSSLSRATASSLKEKNQPIHVHTKSMS
ncbi:alanine dehydrogenase [Pedobacter sp. Leaf216]|uniref:XdhC family protein n=1 Tax=Pedobacter sp. Leaf216 TaxID=1735684 RepID=UPI000700AD24|nr:XdhC/CoxI family protein [Pedobacter sp. Leaf216]KQM73050.1 alanine dehydrogenase [Pedobacter sp. Leaf216]